MTKGTGIIPYEELTIQDNFIFQKVMRNKRICKGTLERLLDIEIKDIGYPEEEKSINVRLDSKSIRLDVYVNDDKGTVFNIEMQTTKDMEELVKRTRYYQALIDIDLLEKGQDYETLNDTYIIFICTFGLFGGNRHKYTFKNLCLEEQGLELKDGTTKMFLSTKGTDEDISKPLKNFLDYIDGQAPADELTGEIDCEVATARSCDDWRREYMTLALAMEKAQRVARAEGIAEGMARGKAEGKAEGMLETLSALVQKKLLTLTEAAKQADMTVEDFSKAVAAL